MRNVYEDSVSQTREYFAYIEVVADSEEEAREIAEEKIKAPDDINWSWGGNYPVEIDDVEFQYEEDDEENEDE
jgi:hypothetical protein